MDNIEPPAQEIRTLKSKQVAADSCVICLDAIAERAITVPCNHVNFDFLCILSWLLDQQARCPLCKTEVTAVQYSFHSSTDFKTFHIPKRTVTGHKTDTNLNSTNSLDLPIRNRSRAQTPPSEQDTALLRRKFVYRHNLYSLHVGANRISKYRNITPSSFSHSPTLQRRARKWIRRELRVFEFLQVDAPSTPSRNTSPCATNTEFLLEYIILVLKSVDIKGSNGRAEDLLQEFLGRTNARLFLHECEAWLRSPYDDIEEWDFRGQYQDDIPYPLPSWNGREKHRDVSRQ